MKVALEQYGDIHVLRWDSYHKSLEDTLAFWIVISKTEMISKSSLRNSTEFKRETSLCSFHKKKKARCLGLYLPGFGNGEGSPFLSPLPPPNLGEDEYDVATRFQLSRSNSEELEMIKASPIPQKLHWKLGEDKFNDATGGNLGICKLMGGTTRENRPVNPANYPANSFHIGVKGFRGTEICVNWSLLKLPPREGDRALHGHF
ncbi:hypothetical protein EAE99_005857 [Botrytis elliptica]|nr:hypothetical protein EAE99_005857 [Botrytis elliptica]